MSTAHGQVLPEPQLDLDPVTAEEYLEVYTGVVPDIAAMRAQLSVGPCLAMEFCGDDAVRKLREVAGPRDIETAKRVRAGTVRAEYGADTARCALHITDLDEDGPLDSEYLFDTLQK